MKISQAVQSSAIPTFQVMQTHKLSPDRFCLWPLPLNKSVVERLYLNRQLSGGLALDKKFTATIKKPGVVASSFGPLFQLVKGMVAEYLLS